MDELQKGTHEMAVADAADNLTVVQEELWRAQQIIEQHRVSAGRAARGKVGKTPETVEFDALIEACAAMDDLIFDLAKAAAERDALQDIDDNQYSASDWDAENQMAYRREIL